MKKENNLNSPKLTKNPNDIYSYTNIQQPQRIVSNQKIAYSSIKSKPNNIDQTSRLSVSSGIAPRITNLNNPKFSDPRPIKEQNFQSECTKKIYDFLIMENFEDKLILKELNNPKIRDFITIFNFLLLKILPDFQSNVQKLELDIPPILISLRYPGVINKNHLIAIGAPNTWANLIALLSWMVELALYVNISKDVDTAEQEEIKKKIKNFRFEKIYLLFEKINTHIDETEINELKTLLNLENLHSEFSTNSETQEKFLKYLEEIFYNDGYIEFMSTGDNFNSLENFNKSAYEVLEYNNKVSEDILKQNENLKQKILEINVMNLDYTKKENELIELKNEINRFNTDISEMDLEFVHSQNEIIEKEKIYLELLENNKKILKENEEIQEIIKNQSMGIDDYEDLKNKIEAIEKNDAELDLVNFDLNDQIKKLEDFESKQKNLIKEKLKNISIYLERNKIEKNIIFNHQKFQENLEKNFSNEGNNSDLANEHKDLLDIELNSLNEFIENLKAVKIEEIKKNEENIFELKTEILRLKDHEVKLNEECVNKKIELENLENIIVSNKEKFNIFSMGLLEDLKKTEEKLNLINLEIEEKEIKIEENKKLEIKIREYHEAEVLEIDKGIDEIENIYNEMLSTCDDRKKLNIKQIKKLNKSQFKINEYFKNNIEDNTNEN